MQVGLSPRVAKTSRPSARAKLLRVTGTATQPASVLALRDPAGVFDDVHGDQRRCSAKDERVAFTSYCWMVLPRTLHLVGIWKLELQDLVACSSAKLASPLQRMTKMRSSGESRRRLACKSTTGAYPVEVACRGGVVVAPKTVHRRACPTLRFPRRSTALVESCSAAERAVEAGDQPRKLAGGTPQARAGHM